MSEPAPPIPAAVDGHPRPLGGDRALSRGPRPWLRALLLSGPIAALFLLFVVTDFRGVDFGHHWDEADWHINPARQMVATGILLPHSYIYPSFDKYLVIVPAIPTGIQTWFQTHGDPKKIQAAMGAVMDAPGYLLRARRVYIFVSALAILWIYGAALTLRFPWWQALIAAAGLGLSWEFAYHARWAVTDCILVQFTALTLWMLSLHHRTGKTGWLYATAVAAGFGFGTKYTGLFLIGSALLSGAFSLPLLPLRHSWGAQVRRALAIAAIAVAVYLVTTPATVMDPVQFFTETKGISDYYGTHHGGYTATSGFNHAQVMLTYLALSFFSPFLVPALVLFLIAVLGGVALIRDDRRLGAVIMLCPFLFLAAFCIRYRVLVVRNCLYTTPVLALMLGRGSGEIAGWISNRWARRALAGALVVGMTVQAGWLIGASQSIRHVDPINQVKAALEYVARHPKDRFRISGRVRVLALQSHLAIPPNVTSDHAPDARHVVFFPQQDGPNPWVWKVNDRWLTEAVFGPREMNFNWYSTWDGHDRVVVMNIDKARSFGVELAK